MSDFHLVLQIANWIQVQGESKPRLRNIFTLDTCAPISGAEVYSFKDEREMLKAWREFIIASDPDLLTGYNIVGFDIPYLVDRAKSVKSFHFFFLPSASPVEFEQP